MHRQGWTALPTFDRTDALVLVLSIEGRGDALAELLFMLTSQVPRAEDQVEPVLQKYPQELLIEAITSA